MPEHQVPGRGSTGHSTSQTLLGSIDPLEELRGLFADGQAETLLSLERAERLLARRISELGDVTDARLRGLEGALTRFRERAETASSDAAARLDERIDGALVRLAQQTSAAVEEIGAAAQRAAADLEERGDRLGERIEGALVRLAQQASAAVEEIGAAAQRGAGDLDERGDRLVERADQAWVQLVTLTARAADETRTAVERVDATLESASEALGAAVESTLERLVSEVDGRFTEMSEWSTRVVEESRWALVQDLAEATSALRVVVRDLDVDQRAVLDEWQAKETRRDARTDARVGRLVDRVDARLSSVSDRLDVALAALVERDRTLEAQRAEEFIRALGDLLASHGGRRRFRGTVEKALVAERSDRAAPSAAGAPPAASAGDAPPTPPRARRAAPRVRAPSTRAAATSTEEENP